MIILNTISRFLGIPAEEITRKLHVAQYEYRRFTIKKRNGKDRIIYHPSAFVKNVQYALIQVFFSKIIINSAAYGFKRKLRSPLLKNALEHSTYQYTVCIDLKDFFLSIRPVDLFDSLEKHNDIMTWFKQATIEEIDKEIIRKYCFVKNRHEEKLAIGSPSSPDISNIVMRVVDVALVEMATSFEGKYTRYADDIIVSYNEKGIGSRIYGRVKEILHENLCNLEINEEKTKFFSKKGKRVVTGMVIGSDSKVSIGRDKKRNVQKQIYKYGKGLLDDREKASLVGYIAFIRDVDIGFFHKLYCKYGDHILDELIGKKKPIGAFSSDLNN